MTDRQAEFPAPSYARTVIVLAPTSRGIPAALQEAVPAAAPELPVEFVQFTSVAATV